MKRYWVIAPYFADPTYEDAYLFDQVWAYDFGHNSIAIGWNELGDVSAQTTAEIRQTYLRSYQDRNAANATRTANIFWNFYHEIQRDDIVIARKGRKTILSLGVVSGTPYYNKAKGIERVGGPYAYHYPNFLPVKWQGHRKHFSEIVFGMTTLYEISLDKFDELVGTH